MDTLETAVINGNFQQAYASNCCGAYSLTSILDAFNAFTIQCDGINIDEGGEIPLQYEGRMSTIAKGPFLKGIANELYKITGSPLLNCQNLPSSILYIASTLLKLSDYEIKIYIFEESYNKIIADFPAYKEEIEKCSQIIGAENVNTKANFVDYRIPQGQWCQQLIVQISSEYDYGDLHWLARDGQGFFYDPIRGTSGNDWGRMTQIDPATKNFSVIKTNATIVMNDVVHCNLPNQNLELDYQWIAFWIDYKKK